MTEPLPLLFRDGRISERPFVFSSWLESHRGSPFAVWLEDPDYFGRYHEVVEKLLDRSRLLLACNIDDPDQIFGYVAYEPKAVHFTYVKNAFRRLGIARALLDRAGVKVCTHLPRFPLRGWTVDPSLVLETVYGRRTKVRALIEPRTPPKAAHAL